MWCFYYATTWSMALLIEKETKLKEFLLNECLALRGFLNAAIVTVGSLLFAMLAARLATCAERLKTSLRQLAVVVPQCTIFVGVAVGISWEKSFNTSAVALLSNTEHKILWQVLLCTVVLLVLLPIWIFFILPMSEERGYLYGFVPRLALTKARQHHEYADSLQPPNAQVLKHLGSLHTMLCQFEDGQDEQRDEQREPQRDPQQDPVDDHYRPLA